MAAHIINHAEKLVPAVKTSCDFRPSLANALEQEAITTTYPTGAVLSKARLHAECSSSVEAE
jgi:hypothetical protein